MTKQKKKAVALFAIFVLLFLIGYWLYPKEQEHSDYIFDKSYNISLEDVNKSRQSLPKAPSSNADSSSVASDKSSSDIADQGGSELDLKKIFSEGLINSYTTLKYFKHLEHLFRKSTTLGEHFAGVKKYLYSQFSEDEARTLFDTYKKYLECEMDLMEQFRNLTSAKTPEEAIETLKEIQQFRRDRLGTELADKLYGADVKAKEYAFRRANIVGNKDLYGEAKEEQLKKLNEDMWGDDAAAVEEHPNNYNRYKEKLLIYKKDLDEIDMAEDRQAKIEQFRNEFFTPEQVKRLDKVDKEIAENKQSETTYREEAKKIQEETGLTEETKNKKIEALQNKMFGDQADAFRRRENMRIGLQKLMEETEKKKQKATE